MKTILQKYFAITAILVFYTVSGFSQLANGNFEAWSGGAPDGWTTIESGITVAQETSTTHGGAAAASINLLTATQGDTDFRQNITVVSGSTYQISFWVYHTEGGARARLYAGDYFVYSDPEILNAWQEVTHSLLAETTGEIEVGLRFYDVAANFDGEEIMYVDDFIFEEEVITGPTVTITSPEEGSTILSDEISASFITQNFVVGDPADVTADGYIVYTIDGNGGDHFNSGPINVQGLSNGPQTLTMELVDASGNSLSPEVISTVQFTIDIPTTTQVNNIAALRAGTIGEFYELTGEAILTYQQGFRNQKFIQDATAGILIDDVDGIIVSTYDIHSGITGISGELGEFGGMMQFVPIADPGLPTSISLNPTIPVVTISDLTNNFEDYESELIQLSFVEFDTPATFENGTEYPISGPTGQYNLRTSFYDVDYIGSATPSTMQNFVGIPNSRPEGEYFTPRNFGDFLLVGIDELNDLQLSLYPNPTVEAFFIENGEQNFFGTIEISDINGKSIQSDIIRLSEGQRHYVDCSALEAGYYFVNLVDEQSSLKTTLTVIVE